MRTNLPVTQREIQLADGETIVSKTDTRGMITFVNRTFIEISGFSEGELIGAPHNVVRHPDMPSEAFRDLWTQLKAGRPWVGMVKNRCKNGDHYWVEAHATPYYENGAVAGYMSVRRKPSVEQVKAAESAYAALRDDEHKRLAVRHGYAVPQRDWSRLNPLARASFQMRMTLSVLVAISAGVGGVVSTRFLSGLIPSLAIVLGTGIVCFGVTVSLTRDAARRLAQTVTTFRNIASGNYNDFIEVRRNDEVGAVLIGLKSLQIQHGFEVQEQQRESEARLRVQQALDQSTTNIMIADAQRNVIFANKSLMNLFESAQADFKKDLPTFEAGRVLGSNIDVFHKHPQHQSKMIADLRETKRVEITLGGHRFSLTVNPVFDAKGHRLGTVVEWRDRTLEHSIEAEISRILAGAAKGDVSQRLTLDGKTGFFREHAGHLNQLLDTFAQALGLVEEAMSALARGDLTHRIETSLEGNFGRVFASVRTTFSSLNDIVRQISSSAGSIAAAAAEVAAGNADLAARTEQQAANLEETASSMEELNSTVKQNADNAKQGNQLALSATQVAGHGGAVVDNVVSTMSSIEGSSKRIAEIIGVIDGIAFQTNILALNAAVEAARAGEQGRGFAVVASEVRNLAQRSANAAKEIKNLISDSVERVAVGADLAGKAGKAMQEIVTAVKSVTTIMGAVSGASQEQSAGIEQVTITINQMDQNTQQNAALVEEASAAARSLEEQARMLDATVARFKIDATSSEETASDNRSDMSRHAPSQISTAKPSRHPVVALRTRGEIAGRH